MKLLYLMAVVLSAIIVIAYLSWKAVIKPPPVAEISPAETQAQAGENTVHTPAPSSTQGDFERRRLCYTFLLVASDQASANADTIMVLTYDTAEQMAGLVSIPRDTLVDRRFPKINAVYHDGIEALRGEVSRMLGIPIDYYICVDVDGFVQVVDAVDGIDFDVPIHMAYDDPLQDLHIHFEPGMQHINGKEALAICRLRKNSDGTMAYPDSDIGRTRTQQQLLAAIGGVDFNVPVNMNYEDYAQDLYIHFNKGMQWLSGSDALKVACCRQNSHYDEAEGEWKTYDAYSDADIGRTETQRNLLTAVLKKALSQPGNFATYYDIFLENVQTDLEMSDLLYFAEKALYFDFSNDLTTSVLPGDSTVTYHGWAYCYELCPDKVLELVNTQGINPYTTDITADMLTIAQKS